MDDLISVLSRVPRPYSAGQAVFEQGGGGTECFIVLEGEVEIRQQNGGTRHVVRRLGPGELFGEMALIDRVPRSASAVATIADTLVMPIDKGRLLYLISHCPGFAVLLMETLGRWLRGPNTGAAAGPTATAQLYKGAPPEKSYEVVRIADGVFQLRSKSRACNAFLFKGPRRTVLVDTGLGTTFPSLAAGLATIGVTPDRIDMAVLTHEHFDHIAGVPHLAGRPVVAAHRLAAHKIANGDKFAIYSGSFSETCEPFRVDLVLDEGTVIETGSHRLRVYHTPGHTSGSISLIEETSGLLVSGDIVLPGGPLSGIFGSGNISDAIYSLEMLAGLRPTRLLPGHGPISETPAADIAATLEKSRELTADTRRVLDVLNAQESINKTVLAVRDLNR